MMLVLAKSDYQRVDPRSGKTEQVHDSRTKAAPQAPQAKPHVQDEHPFVSSMKALQATGWSKPADMKTTGSFWQHPKHGMIQLQTSGFQHYVPAATKGKWQKVAEGPHEDLPAHLGVASPKLPGSKPGGGVGSTTVGYGTPPSKSSTPDPAPKHQTKSKYTPEETAAYKAKLQADAKTDPTARFKLMKLEQDEKAGSEWEDTKKKIDALNKREGVEVWKRGETEPGEINGVPIKAEERGHFDEPDAQINEKPMPEPDEKWIKRGAGVITVEPDGRVFIVEPHNHFAGYQHTFPGGTQDRGLTLQQTARKEAHEESGLRTRIIGHLGDYQRSASDKRYYIGVREGGHPGSAHWETYCVGVDTKILTSSMHWRKASELSIGDDLLGFSENHETTTGGQKARIWHNTKVTSHAIENRETVAVKLSSGRVLYCTPEHRWLAKAPKSVVDGRPSGTATVWVEARHLVGERGRKWMLGRYMESWDEDSSWLAGWLAGILGGEGSLFWHYRQSKLDISQNEGPTLNRIRDALRYYGISWSETRRPPKRKNGPENISIHIIGSMARKLSIVGMVGVVGARRLMDKVMFVDSARNRLQAIEWDQVISVEPVGITPVVVMSTTTGTFLAEGYGAHNCTKLVPHDQLKDFLNRDTDKTVADDLSKLIAKAQEHGDDLHEGLEHVLSSGAWKPTELPKRPKKEWDQVGKPKIDGASLSGIDWKPSPKKGQPLEGKPAEDDPTKASWKEKLAHAFLFKGEARDGLLPEDLGESEPEPLWALSKSRKLHYRTDFQGLPISIENRKGSLRHWHDPMTGRDGVTKMPAAYGYIRLTEGNDGEKIDIFLGPNPEASMVYIVRQVNPVTGAYDEDKCLAGFDSMEEARQTYLDAYDDPRFLGRIIAMPMSLFRLRIKETQGGPVPTHPEMAKMPMTIQRTLA
jgi:Inorganic Pyrophosphatase/NUDIX domain